MTTPKDREFEKPARLSPKGSEAYRVIMAFLKAREWTDAGGCKVFYSPKEWKERGEQYGQGAELIVVHDGGDHRPAFTLDCGYKVFEALNDELGKIGLYVEMCTCWHAAVYKV